MGTTALLIAAGIPSAITAFCFWVIEHRIQRTETERKERDEERQQLMMHILTSVNASMGLAEATARAVQKIPDAHCNGDMHTALDYCQNVKREQREFLAKAGIKILYDN